MIILVASPKGGVGKTTTATNIAGFLVERGGDALLVDADLPQASSAGWAEIRPESLPRVPGVQLSGNLIAPIRDLAGRYKNVVIDAGGRDSPEVRSGMVLADVFVLPILPSAFDVWSTAKIRDSIEAAEAVRERPLIKVAFLNRCPTTYNSRDEAEARELLAELEIELLPASLHERRAFRRAAGEGLTVAETKPRDASAHREVGRLLETIEVRLRGQEKPQPPTPASADPASHARGRGRRRAP